MRERKRGGESKGSQRNRTIDILCVSVPVIFRPCHRSASVAEGQCYDLSRHMLRHMWGKQDGISDSIFGNPGRDEL